MVLGQQAQPKEPELPSPILPGATFDYQLDVYKKKNVGVFIFDGFRVNKTISKQLADNGTHVLCYFSAGTIETWSPDFDRFKGLLGKKVIGRDQIYWIDNSKISLLEPIFLDRIKLAKESHCSGIDWANTNSYTQDTGVNVNPQSAFYLMRKLYEWTHKNGLLVGLSNNPNFNFNFGELFDYRIVTTCTFDDSCQAYQNFTKTNKPVFGLEYADADSTPATIAKKCNAMYQGNITGIIRDYTMNTDGFYFSCPVARLMDINETIPNLDALKKVGRNPVLQLLKENRTISIESGSENNNQTSKKDPPSTSEKPDPTKLTTDNVFPVSFDYVMSRLSKRNTSVYIGDGYNMKKEFHTTGGSYCVFAALRIFNMDPDKSLIPPNMVSSTNFLDISKNVTMLQPYFASKLKRASENGCDGVVWNIEDPLRMQLGFTFSLMQMLNYLSFLSKLAKESNAKVGILHPGYYSGQASTTFDFAVAIKCGELNQCDNLAKFVAAKKPVFNIEFGSRNENVCKMTNDRKINTIFRDTNFSGDSGVYSSC
ncbi:hypothetical protein MP638_003440 [Amoeboaphelidium occidentale]|nr:hypothetical protein MP638_003440 [Amoeboaphelidium occidentale]